MLLLRTIFGRFSTIYFGGSGLGLLIKLGLCMVWVILLFNMVNVWVGVSR